MHNCAQAFAPWGEMSAAVASAAFQGPASWVRQGITAALLKARASHLMHVLLHGDYGTINRECG
jgi:hypothetical protein